MSTVHIPNVCTYNKDTSCLAAESCTGVYTCTCTCTYILVRRMLSIMGEQE